MTTNTNTNANANTKTLVSYWFSLVIGVSIAALFLRVPIQQLGDIIMGITIALLLISPKWDRLWNDAESNTPNTPNQSEPEPETEPKDKDAAS